MRQVSLDPATNLTPPKAGSDGTGSAERATLAL